MTTIVLYDTDDDDDDYSVQLVSVRKQTKRQCLDEDLALAWDLVLWLLGSHRLKTSRHACQ